MSEEKEKESEIEIPNNEKRGSDQVQDIIPKLGTVNKVGTYPFIKPGKPFQPRTNNSR